MGRRMSEVTNLEAYWRREHDFRRRMPLINGDDIVSLDAPSSLTERFLYCRPRPRRTAKWEMERIRLACAMLPPDLKRYQKVLWSIYYHRPSRSTIAHNCGYSVRQYRTVFALLWHFMTGKRQVFIRLNRRQDPF